MSTTSTPPETRRPSVLRLPATVVRLGVVSLMNDASSEMIFPLLPVFLRSTLGLSESAAALALGWMEGLAESANSLLRLAAGWLGDRLPRRKPLVLGGYALASATRPLIALVTAPWQLVVLRFVDRVGKGVRGAPRDALIADSVDPARRGLAFGFHRSMDHLGAIVGPGLAWLLLLLAPGRYRLVFALAAVPAIGSLFVLAGVRERERPRPSPPEEEGMAQTKRPSAPLPRSLWLLLGILFLFTLGNASDAFLLLRARELGVPAAALPLIWMVLHIVKSAGSTPAGWLSDRIPRRRLIAAGWGVYAVTYAGFAWAGAAWHAWALFALYGVYFGLVEGTEKAMVADLAPAAARSTAFGAYNFAVGLGALPASLVSGYLWKWFGAPIALGFGAGVALLAAVLLLVAPLRTPARP
ncbi:MAG: MFS transporter [Armatimonadetes bacterium]|nr:MFS transporter [Armatimonadota bacterium]